MDAVNRIEREPAEVGVVTVGQAAAMPSRRAQRRVVDGAQSRQIVGRGTPERAWRAAMPSLPVESVETLVPPGRRAVVIAPHPDDEVLGVGGTMAALSALGREVMVVSVTDGEASHPGSTRWPAEALRRARAAERVAALRRLGLARPRVERLGLADGAVDGERVRRRLLGLLRPTDVVWATWWHDGHPDHEVVGRAAAAACLALEATLYAYPVWMWHWATPGDPRVPWHRLRRIPLDAASAERKQAAVEAFTSQLEPDPTTGRAAVLPPWALARLCRPFEVVVR